VLGISFGHDDQSGLRARLAKAFDRFHEVSNSSDREVAELLHEADAQMTRMKGGKKDSLEIANVDVLPMLN